MKLPKVSGGIGRGMYKAIEQGGDGVLPSLGGLLGGDFSVLNPRNWKLCQVKCRAVQAAETAACAGSALCAAAAQLKGEKCVTDC